MRSVTLSIIVALSYATTGYAQATADCTQERGTRVQQQGIVYVASPPIPCGVFDILPSINGGDSCRV